MDSRTRINEFLKLPDNSIENFMNDRIYQQTIFEPQTYCSRPIPDVSPRIFSTSNNTFMSDRQTPLLDTYENCSACNQAPPVAHRTTLDFLADGTLGGTDGWPTDAGYGRATIYRSHAPQHPLVGLLTVGPPVTLFRVPVSGRQTPPPPPIANPSKKQWRTELPPNWRPSSEEEPTHPYSDRESPDSKTKDSKTRSRDKNEASVHIGGLLTLPMDGRNTWRVNKDPAVSETVLRGCLEMERLVKRYNVGGEPDLRRLCREVVESVGGSGGGVLHMEAVMRSLALGFLQLSGSWSTLASLTGLPSADRCRSLRNLRRTFRRWQESTRQMLEDLVVALNSLPDDYEKYFTKNFESYSRAEKPIRQRPPKYRLWKRGGPPAPRYPYRQRKPWNRKAIKPNGKILACPTNRSDENQDDEEENESDYRDASDESESTYCTCPAVEPEESLYTKTPEKTPPNPQKTATLVLRRSRRTGGPVKSQDSGKVPDSTAQKPIGFYGSQSEFFQSKIDPETVTKIVDVLGFLHDSKDCDEFWFKELIQAPTREIVHNVESGLYERLIEVFQDIHLLFNTARTKSLKNITTLMVINRKEIEVISRAYCQLHDSNYS